jgi:hypothetical protein
MLVYACKSEDGCFKWINGILRMTKIELGNDFKCLNKFLQNSRRRGMEGSCWGVKSGEII